jgi:hypothetical protein
MNKNELPTTLLWIAGAFFTLVGLFNVVFKRRIASWNDRTAVSKLGSDPTKRNAYPSVKVAGIAVLILGVVLLIIAAVVTI